MNVAYNPQHILLEDATYVDNQLGIVLYKHHLLATYKNFQVYDLTKAERIYHYVYTQNLTE